MFKITNRKSCVARPPRRQALHGNRQQSCSARSTECRGSRAAMPWLVIILFNPQCSTRTYLLVGWQSHFAVGRYILSDFLYSTECRVQKAAHRTNSPRPALHGNGRAKVKKSRPITSRSFDLFGFDDQIMAEQYMYHFQKQLIGETDDIIIVAPELRNKRFCHALHSIAARLVIRLVG